MPALRINGRPRTVAFEPHDTLLDVLRDRLQLTGSKLTCDRGECGACTVLLDGRPAYACLTLAAGLDQEDITTIEGLAAAGTTHALQRAFIAHDAAQCGFCTPGQLLAASALIATHSDPSDDDIRREMSGNLCRCGTYPNIIKAIKSAAAELRSDAAIDAAIDATSDAPSVSPHE
jgi:xanthine dehydrogenase YagT iron-sulfur-binding subunit